MQAMNPVVDRRKMKQAHDVTYLAENSPIMPRRYESEEEDISEAETNGHGRMYSPIDGDSDVGAFDSELSADEQASDDVQDKLRDIRHRNTLSPYLSTGQKSRPVSIDTIKRSSAATFVPGSLYHDDDDEIMSSATPRMTSSMSSPFLTATRVLVPEDASDEDTDMASSLLVATPIIFMMPSSRPRLIWISSARSRLTKQDNASRLGRCPSKSSRSSGSVRNGSRPRTRRSNKRQSSSLSLSATQSGESYVAPSTSLHKQARRSTIRSSSMGQLPSVQDRDHSRNREAFFFDSPTLGFLTEETRVGDAQTSATITNFSKMPPMPHPLSPRSMSVSFPVPLSFSPEGKFVASQSQRPTSSMGPLSAPRRIPSFNSVQTTGAQRPTFLSSPDIGKPFKPILPYMNLHKKDSRRGSRSISMSFRLQSQVGGRKPPLTESPVSYKSSPDCGHQRSMSTFDGGFGSRRLNATYPHARNFSLSYTPLGIRSSSTIDLGSAKGRMTGSGYDADISPRASKDKNQQRIRDRGDSQSRLAGKGFMGFRLGRKKRASTTHDN